MGKKAAGSKPVWSIAGNPLQTTSLKAGLLDSIFWPSGMPEPVKKNWAMILAQVIFPLREQTAYNQVQIEKLMKAAGAQPADAQPAASAGSDGSEPVQGLPSATAAASDGNPALDPSLCFKLTEEDLADDPVQAAVGRLEACALGILETLKETIPAMQCIPWEARNLPSMSVPDPVASAGQQNAVVYGPFAAPVPQAYPGGPLQVYPNLGAPVACSPAAPPQACSLHVLSDTVPLASITMRVNTGQEKRAGRVEAERLGMAGTHQRLEVLTLHSYDPSVRIFTTGCFSWGHVRVHTSVLIYTHMYMHAYSDTFKEQQIFTLLPGTVCSHGLCHARPRSLAMAVPIRSAIPA